MGYAVSSSRLADAQISEAVSWLVDTGDLRDALRLEEAFAAFGQAVAENPHRSSGRYHRDVPESALGRHYGTDCSTALAIPQRRCGSYPSATSQAARNN